MLLNGGYGKLTPAAIKSILSKFQQVDKDGSGTIDYYEFCEVMEQEDSPLLKRVFEMFDFDRSGSIELKELVVGLSSYTNASLTEKLKFSFLMFDEDRSGFIERGELRKMLKTNCMQGDVDEADIDARVDKAFRMAGVAPDGKLSFEQFQKLSEADPALLFPAYNILGHIDRKIKRGVRAQF